MSRHHYELVNVFTDRPFGGNPLAVFTNAADIPVERMRFYARELNLSEAVFVLPPESDDYHFRLRIFTPQMELPMAGHPTVGAAHVLYSLGRAPTEGPLRFLEGVGVVLVHFEITDGAMMAWMTQPLPQFGPVLDDRAAVAALLSLDESDLIPDLPVQVVSTGVPFVYVPLRGLDAIRRAAVRLDVWESLLKDTPHPHVFVLTLETEQPGSSVHTRMFAPAMGIPEDPATGAASGPLGAYLARYALVDNPAAIVSEQGFEMGRPSMIRVRVDYADGVFRSIAIGGQTQPVGAGYFLAE
ncbi:MAG: PhzF family phenazine biosynthesis protein [Chloroflexota bacterium]